MHQSQRWNRWPVVEGFPNSDIFFREFGARRVPIGFLPARLGGSTSLHLLGDFSSPAGEENGQVQVFQLPFLLRWHLSHLSYGPFQKLLQFCPVDFCLSILVQDFQAHVARVNDTIQSWGLHMCHCQNTSLNGLQMDPKWWKVNQSESEVHCWVYPLVN